MKKSALLSAVAQESGLTKAQVESVLAATATQVEAVIKSGEDSVTVLGIKIGSRQVAERSYPNLKDPSAAPTVKSAHTAATFKAGKALKEAVA